MTVYFGPLDRERREGVDSSESGVDVTEEREGSGGSTTVVETDTKTRMEGGGGVEWCVRSKPLPV